MEKKNVQSIYRKEQQLMAAYEKNFTFWRQSGAWRYWKIWITPTKEPL